MGERGFTLLELLLAIPVLVLVALTLSYLAGSAAHGYEQSMVRTELRHELNAAFERVLEDTAGARALTRDFPGQIRIVSDGRGDVSYFINEKKGEYLKKLCYNSATAPLTGNHAWARVEVKEFGFSEDAGHPGLYTIYLSGKAKGGETYSLSTRVYLPPQP